MNLTNELKKHFQCQLPGFYDPCIGIDKVLTIQYTYRDQNYEVTINDNEALRIPRPHCKYPFNFV